jgi:hypothetical protein
VSLVDLVWNFCCFLLSTATTIVFSIDESTELVELCPVLYLNGMTGSEQHAEEWHDWLMPFTKRRWCTRCVTLLNRLYFLLLLRYFA